jgi:hypothetical protein
VCFCAQSDAVKLMNPVSKRPFISPSIA